MNRRNFLVGTGTLFLALNIAPVKAQKIIANSEKIELWHGVPPGGGGPSGSELLTSKGALSNVMRPYLQVFRPAKPNGKVVIIAAGGGYKRMEMGSEAWPAAGWLTDRGYTAYVLVYRLPSESWNAGSIVALQDAQRAMRIVKSLESELTLLGFSAGGHLLGMAATLGDSQTYVHEDNIDSISAVAKGAALIYPIVTLESPYTHTSTHKILLGPLPSAQEEADWSLQNRVTSNTPPEFLVQAEDDPISNPQNTLIMAAACVQHHVPIDMHRYSTGGHGFGLGKPGTPTVEWPRQYEKWLQNLGAV